MSGCVVSGGGDPPRFAATNQGTSSGVDAGDGAVTSHPTTDLVQTGEDAVASGVTTELDQVGRDAGMGMLDAGVVDGEEDATASGPLAGERYMTIVAHPDDDLGMNPELERVIRGGASVFTIMITGGDASFPCIDYIQGREDGSRAAYAKMAGVPDAWDETLETWAGHTVRVTALHGTRVRVAWLGLPNSLVSSIAPLWHGALPELPTLPFDTRRPLESFTRESLIETLRQAIDAFDPTQLRANDASKLWPEVWPFDHADHVYSGHFVLAALGRSQANPAVAMPRGYNIQFEQVNLSPDEIDAVWSVFEAYFVFDPKICQEEHTTICGVETGCDVPEVVYRPLQGRSYAVRFMTGEGALLAPALSTEASLCVSSRDDALDVTACPEQGREPFRVREDATIRDATGSLCFTATAAELGSEVRLAACADLPEQWFAMSDVGQLRGPGASCVEVVDGHLHIAECADKTTQRPFSVQ